MTAFAHEHVVKFFGLYTSERREIAEWLSVPRQPEENDTDYAKRILLAAKDAGKIHELADRIEGLLAARPAERALDVESKEAVQWSETIRLKSQNEALRAVVVDMLAGLAYLRSTNSVPYGFGIDRLEQHGKAALG